MISHGENEKNREPACDPAVFQGTGFDRLVHRSRDEWFETIARIEKILDRPGFDREGRQRQAEEVRRMTDRLDGLIEEMTAAVCPACRAVCCINRHSWPDENDLAYLLALGATPPPFEEGLDENEPCRFLSAAGCSIPRSLRPFRCNWYFCDPLVDAMDGLPAKKHRIFSNDFSRLVESRARLIDGFIATPRIFA